MLYRLFEELLVLGEIEQPYELIGPEPSLGLAADASQRLFDQGVIYRLFEELSLPLTTQGNL